MPGRGRRRSGACAALLPVVVAVAGCGGAGAQPPAAAATDGGCPAYAAEAYALSAGGQTGDHFRYDYDVLLLDEGLRPLRQLTDDGRSYRPDFSPDGHRVTYYSGRGYSWPTESSNTDGPEPTSIRVVGVDGTGDRELTHGHIDRSPRWSPDGTRVVFLRSVPGGENLVMVWDEATDQVTEVGAQYVENLSWFSDDEVEGLAYDPDGYTRYVWRLDVTTGVERRVDLGVPDLGSGVLWNPDRTAFAYVVYPDFRTRPYDPAERPEIRVRELATGADRVVPGSNTLVNQLVLWSAADVLMFQRNVGGEGYNLAVSADGGRAAARVLAPGGVAFTDPTSANPACAP